MGERAVGRHAADAEALLAGHDGGGPRDQEPGPAVRSVTQVRSLARLVFKDFLLFKLIILLLQVSERAHET